MTSSAMRGYSRGFLLAVAGITLVTAAPVRAQDVDEPLPETQHSQLPPGAVVQPLDSGPGAELRRNLNTLASNPRSLDALIGAGRAAITLGDGESALGFFTRAQEIAPNDPRVKAGLASAMLHRERPEQALILFAEAVQRGAPEAEIAGDRGLAYDMVGDPRHAQQDYALALRRRDDPEIERRLALSLAISGQRDAALRVIDGQLRRQDRAGWRTQAFVLALTGDPSGADDTARRLMPPPNASAMAPFFARLASLSPAQKAAAVNFGRFPSDGGATRVASNVDTRADPGALAMAQGGPQVRPQYPLAEPVNDAPRRRPGPGEQRADSLIRRPREEIAPAVQPSRRIETAQAQPQRFAPADPEEEDEADDEARQSDAQPQRAPVNRPREAPAFVPGGNFTLDTSHEERIPQPPVQSATPGFGPTDQTLSPSVRQFQPFTIQPSQAPATRPGPGTPALSDIASVVRALPGEDGNSAPAARPTAPAAPLSLAERQARDAAARDAEARYRNQAPPGSARAGSATSARYWVQIAHGAQRGALAGQYRQVRAQAPALIDSRSAWTVADRSTNRLLIGPFDSERSAREYIDQLDRRQIAAIPWTSAAGQSADRLQAGGASSSSRARPDQADRQPASTSRSSRNRQAEERSTSSSDRHSSPTRSSGAAAASDDRAGTSGPARTRAGRAATSDRNNARAGSSRDRAATSERSTARGRNGRDRAGADDNRTSATRPSARRGSGNAERASTPARSTTSRRASDDAPRTSRNRSTPERRTPANDTRTSRGRSSEEQGPAPSRRRSH